MGKSAKLHKRPKNLKKPSTANTAAAAAIVVGSGPQAQAQTARKKAGLKQKQKASGNKGSAGQTPSRVLGDADYVSLMMGSRKKAREEAAKLPQDQ